MKSLKFALVVSWAAIVALGLILFVHPVASKEATSPNAAIVNGIGISAKDFDRELDMYFKRNKLQPQDIPGNRLSTIKEAVLQDMIDRELLYQESKKKGIEIGEQAISDQLNELKARYTNEAAFQQALTQIRLSEADVRIQIEHGMAIQQLIAKEVVDDIDITEKEVRSYYDSHPEMFKQPEQVKASHILIKVDQKASGAQKDQAREKMETIQKKLDKGEDFAALAREYSEGPSKVKGGDLGYFRRGQMVKPFEEAAFALQKNEVSDIVETRFGYHLIKVSDKRPPRVLSYVEVKDQLTRFMKKEEVESQTQLYIENLRKDADIEKLL